MVKHTSKILRCERFLKYVWPLINIFLGGVNVILFEQVPFCYCPLVLKIEGEKKKPQQKVWKVNAVVNFFDFKHQISIFPNTFEAPF